MRKDLILDQKTSIRVLVGIARDAITDQVIDLSTYTARATFVTQSRTTILALTSESDKIELNEDGSVYIVLDPADTPTSLKFGLWDMRLEDADGHSYLLARGTADIRPTITPFPAPAPP